MQRDPRSHIVADGQWRILEGSGRDYAASLRLRLEQRSAPLRERASLLGRVAISFRISRFIRRRLRQLAPPEALYSLHPNIQLPKAGPMT